MDEFIIELRSSRRMPNDPFFANGNAYCSMGRIEPVYDVDEEELCHATVPVFSCDAAGCFKTFTLVYEYEQHYNSAHRYVCKECRKTLPSPHLLDLHIMEAHDTYFSLLAERKPMYQCFVEECIVKFSTPEERRSHCIDLHKFPSNFRYDCAKKSKSKKDQIDHKKEIIGDDAEVAAGGESKKSIMGNSSKLPPTKSNISCTPKAFTFGYNQERAFAASKTRGGKSKHWYQKKKNADDKEEISTTKEIPNMGELMDVLPSH
ncbi:protein lethal(2)k10201 [Hetaerina americana]|uniref:protein lethal(2)k10201 n=1 Tax=Hetaerina americana TaxID=62018 RepID=UPI003A7F233A